MLTDTSREAAGLQGRCKPPCAPNPAPELRLRRRFPAWLRAANSKALPNSSAKCTSEAQTPVLYLSK